MAAGRKIRTPRGALLRLRAADPGLGVVIDRVGPFRMRQKLAENDLESLVRAIVYQQLSGKAAATIYTRFRGLFSEDRFPAAEEILRVHHMRLQKCGLSRQKRAAIRDLCQHVASGRLPLGDLDPLGDDAVIERLTAVRGIGRWSAHMFMMFHLGRIDIWPIDDLGVRKGVMRIRELPELPPPRAMHALGELYRPYRSIAAWYMWRSLEGEAQL
jgi:3-methyladenine DNA glycosylase/8-oxoguanine DNA glycosylase